ncbi:AB-hydrolase YheT [Clavulina sp. PMI_390]|nr:AB-hydrolase YheT [Clavulina sp. PMI_390]
MSAVRAAMQSLRGTSHALWLAIASFFISLWTSFRLTFLTRKHFVELVTNEEKSAPVSANTDTTIMEMIKEKCPSLYGPKAYFNPTWWLPGGNVQTVWCVLAEMFYYDPIPYTRQLLRLPDGGTISLDVYPAFESKEDDTPILFILHGLTGSTQESYIRSTVRDVTRSKVYGGEKGVRVVAMNFRGCDVDTPVTSQRLYHAGETDDTRSALLWLTETYPNAPIYGAGYSMGACTMAQYLGQEGDKTPLKGAICVSNPWDWTIATHYIEHGSWLNRYIYGPILADALLTMFKNSRYAFETDERLNIPDIYSKRYTIIRFFDDRVTSKLFNFEDAWDYYRQASCEKLIDKIAIPHLSLHTEDDPMVAPFNIPYAKARRSPYVVMGTTYGGGHVAWFTTATNPQSGQKHQTRWFGTPIREFVEAIQSVDPAPKPGMAALGKDAKGLTRARDMPDRVGFMEYEDDGTLMTARKYWPIVKTVNIGS